MILPFSTWLGRERKEKPTPTAIDIPFGWKEYWTIVRKRYYLLQKTVGSYCSTQNMEGKVLLPSNIPFSCKPHVTQSEQLVRKTFQHIAHREKPNKKPNPWQKHHRLLCHAAIDGLPQTPPTLQTSNNLHILARPTVSLPQSSVSGLSTNVID